MFTEAAYLAMDDHFSKVGPMFCVIPCVDYDDILAITLPRWQAILGDNPFMDCKVIVVTSPADERTQELCHQFRNIQTCITSAFYCDGAKFNKAAALDVALDDVMPGDVVLALDADSYPIGQLPKLEDIKSDTIYGCVRRACPDLETFQRCLSFQDLPILRGIGPFAKRSRHKDTPEVLKGYFQLFRYNGTRFGSFPTAADYDRLFAEKYDQGITLDTIQVVHLGQNRTNWKGRKSPRWE